jgi:hypothetical protein
MISWLAFSKSTWLGIPPNDVAGADRSQARCRVAVTAGPTPRP